MLLKASKSILTIFEQYFCENPSKLESKQKDVILPHISVKEIFEEKKNVHFWIRTTLTKWTFFSIGPIWMIFMGGRVNTCYSLDFEKILQKKGKKGKKRAKFEIL